MEGIRHIFIAARLQYGHKNKPIEIISSGLDIHLTLRLCITTRVLTVAKIESIFETAKKKGEKISRHKKSIDLLPIFFHFMSGLMKRI